MSATTQDVVLAILAMDSRNRLNWCDIRFNA
jgi:hypothetical protein